MNYFGVRLKYLRMQDNLTQSELGNALEIAKSTISMYESGKREPDFETIEKFADYFNVDMATFFPSGEIEKTADPKVDGLSPKENELLTLYRGVNPDGQRYILQQAEFANSREEYRLSLAPTAKSGA